MAAEAIFCQADVIDRVATLRQSEDVTSFPATEMDKELLTAQATPKQIEITVTDMKTGISEIVTIPVDAELEASLKAAQEFEWCDCGKSTDSDFRDDDECDCGIEKHHYHCTNCGHVSQIG